MSGEGAAVAALADAARATWAAGNSADGQRLKACYELFRACVRDEASGVDDARPGYAVVDPFDVCSNRLVAAFAISSGRADRMISLSVDLTERYPAVLGALVQGRIDQQAAELLARQMQTVNDSVVGRVQQEAVDAYLSAVEGGQRPGRNAVRDMVDQIIDRHDADGVRLRKEDASRDRGVSISKGRDGMSTLWATLASDEAAVLAEALDQRAADFDHATSSNGAASSAGATTPDASTAPDAAATSEAAPDMSRHSLAERRADALMALVCGEPLGSPLTAHTPGVSEVSPLRPKVTVIAPRAGSGDEPVVAFPRTGQSSIQALLAMLGTGDGASLERIDPAIGAYDDPARFQIYRPSAALARAVRLRDGTCRHPGCTVSAEYCDLDHLVPFDHENPDGGGQTCECNLVCLCRKHHRFKTFSDWRYSMERDGALVVVAPDGTSMRSKPDGPLATYRREQEDAERDKWDAQQRRTPATEPSADSPAEPTYWQRRAARTRAERRLAARTHQARQAERAARTESHQHGAGAVPADPAQGPVSIIERRLRDLLHPPPF